MKSVSRVNLIGFSSAALILSSSLLAGCGGSSSGASAFDPSLAGTYQGVGLNTSGPSSPDATTVKLIVDSTGHVTGTGVDVTGDGSTNNFTGTVDGNGVLTTPLLTAPFVKNKTTNVSTSQFTETNGTKGTLNLGIAPMASTLTGTFSGSATPSGGTAGTATFTIAANGAITGAVALAGKTSSLLGFVDSSNNVFLAYKSPTVSLPSAGLGTLSLGGSGITGQITENHSDGTTSTIALSLAKTSG